MAAADFKVTDASTRRKVFSVCTFCNSSTNGFDKKLFTSPQPKGPFFPVLAEMENAINGMPDELGRVVVCVACFHHLLRQWSSYERRCIPLSKRNYNLITDDRVNKFQYKREDEIRREADLRLKEIKNREERICQEAEEKLQHCRQREEKIKQESELRLTQEHKEQEEIRKETERQLREELKKEEEIKREVEEQILEQKQKADYIRQEAERLLREEKLSKKAVSETNLNSLQEIRPLSSDLGETLYENQRSVSVPELQRCTLGLSGELDSESTQGMESTTIVSQTESGIRLRRSSEDEHSAEARRQRRRERSRSREERENVKFSQKVEYQVVLKTESRSSVPDSSSGNAERNEDSGQPKTATSGFTFVANGQEERGFDDKKLARGKEEDFDEEDIRKAGEEMKARFEEGRKVFEKAPEEAANLKADDRAAKRKRDLGRKRAQFLFRGASDAPTPAPRQQPQSGDSGTSCKINDSSSQLEPAKKEEPVAAPRHQSYKQPEAQRVEQQPPQQQQSLHMAKDVIDGRRFPEEDEEAKRRRKNREERNKRRREGEGVRSLHQSDPRDSATERKPESKASENLKRLSQSELLPAANPDSSTAEKTQVDEGMVEPVKQEKQEAEVSLTFDFPQREMEELRNFSQTKQEKNAEEEKSFIPQSGSSEKKDGGFSPVNRDEVDSTFLVSLDSQDVQKPAMESIQTAVPTQRGIRAENETIGDERKRKKKEMEEKRRRIEERQRKAAEEKRRLERGETVPEKTEKAKVPEEAVGDRQERRKSLLLMWESMSDQAPPSPRSPDTEEEPVEIFKKDIKPIRRENSLKREKKVHNLEEYSEPSTEQQEMEVKTYYKQQLVDVTPTWNKTDKVQINGNSVGDVDQRQKEDKNLESRVQNGLSLEKEKKSFLEFIPNELVQESSYEEARGDNEVESSPEPLWRSEDGYGMDSDDDDQQRRPFYEQDEHHRMTEDEAKWESAGHFQPGKLDTRKFNKFAKTDKGDTGKSSLKKNDASRYDWLKKMHNTQSKQEILVPTKLKVNSQGGEVLEENEAEPESDRPYVVEKLDERLTVQFQRGESQLADDQKNRLEKERRKQEQKEIERARIEEENRREREKQEEENEKEEFYSDEVDKKVKMGNVGGKVDVSIWQRLCDEKDMKQPENVQKRKEKKIDVLSFEKGPGAAYELQDNASSRMGKAHPGTKGTVIDGKNQPLNLEQEPKEEDEFERRIKIKSIQKLPEARFALQQTADDERRKQLEEERIKRELEEMEFLRQEELKRRQVSEDEQEEMSDDSDKDEFDRRIKKQEVKKLQLENYGIRAAEKQKDISVIPQKQTKQKTVVLEEQPKEEIIEIEKAPEPVESTPIDLEEEDEFEVKIKKGAVNRLEQNVFLNLQQRSEDEKRKQLEEERIKREFEEMELLRQEELKRRQVSETEQEEKSEDSDQDEFDRRIRKQGVKKLQLENYGIPNAETQKDISVIPKKQTKQKTVVLEQQPKEEIVEIEKAPEPVESTPIDLEEEDEFEIKIKKGAVNRLEENVFLNLQQRSEDEKRKQLDKERIRRRESEEMELLRQEEELRRRQVSEKEQKEKYEDSDEDEFDRRIRKQGVKKLQLENYGYRAPEKQKDISVIPQKQTKQKTVVLEEQPKEEIVEIEKAPEPVESTPIDLEEEDEFEVKIKKGAVNRLEQNVFLNLQQRSEDEKRKQLEEERIKRELEEMELLRQEELKRRQVSETEQEEKSEDSDQDEFDRRIRKQGVKKLQLENYGIPHAETQKDISVIPKKQTKQKTVVLEEQPKEEIVEIEKAPEPVESTPIDLEEEDEFEIKIKKGAVNRLEENVFLNLQQRSEDEKRKQLEKERIKRRESEEMELLRQEEELRRRQVSENEQKEKYEDSDEDDFDRRIRKQGVKKLQLENYGYRAPEKQKDISVIPQKQTKQKTVILEQQPKEEIVEIEKAPEPVERTPIDLEEEDEFEVKIKKGAVNRLEQNVFLNLKQRSEDEKRKQLEEERIKRELEEMELLRQEELKRRQVSETEQEEKSEDSDQDEFDRRIRKQGVKKLQLENYGYCAPEKQNDISVIPQKQTKQKTVILQQQPKEEIVEIEKAPEPVERMPIDLEEEDEYEIKIKKGAVNRLEENVFLNLKQRPDDEQRKQIAEDRIKREMEEMELSRQEELKRQTIVETKEVQQFEEKKVGKLSLENSPFTAADRRALEQPKTRNFKEGLTTRQDEVEYRPQEQAKLEDLRQEARRSSEDIGTNDEFETLQNVDMDKPKPGKLNQDLMSSFMRKEVSTETTRPVLVEKESKRKSTTNLYEIENKPSSETNLEARSESNEEKRRVGRLNVNWMDVVKDETKKGKHAHSSAALQQKAEQLSENDLVSAKQVEVVESTPPMAVDSEDAVYEQKRKSKGVKRIDVHNFIKSTSQDIEVERKKRKQELEQERQRIERQEIEQQRQEQLQRIKYEQEVPLKSDDPSNNNTNYVIETSDSTKLPEGKLHPAAEEDHSGKKRGRLHLGNNSGFSEKESKPVQQQGKVNLGMWEDIDRNAKGKKQKSPSKDSADGIKTVHNIEKLSPESSQTRSSRNEDEKESEQESPVRGTPEEKRRCGRLDRSRFASFEVKTQQGTSALRRSKSERQLTTGRSEGDSFETRTQDDSGVQRRVTQRPSVQKSRPKSIAVMGGETAGQSAPAQKKVVLIGRDDEASEFKTDISTNGAMDKPKGHIRSVGKVDTSAWESRTSKRN